MTTSDRQLRGSLRALGVVLVLGAAVVAIAALTAAVGAVFAAVAP